MCHNGIITACINNCVVYYVRRIQAYSKIRTSAPARSLRVEVRCLGGGADENSADHSSRYWSLFGRVADRQVMAPEVRGSASPENSGFDEKMAMSSNSDSQ